MPTPPLRYFDLSHPQLAGELESLTARIYVTPGRRFTRYQHATRRYQFALPTTSPVFTAQDLTGAVIEHAVGSPDQSPTAGTFSGSYDGATDDLTGLAYNISAAALQTALNANSNITAAGGVTVTQTGDLYTIVFDDDGARELLLWDTESLTPPCVAVTAEVQEGDVDTPSIQTLQLVQQPWAFVSMSGGDISTTTATGTLAFNRLGLLAAFANTTANSVSGVEEIRITWPGEEPEVVYRGTVQVFRDLIEGVSGITAVPPSPYPSASLLIPLLEGITGYIGGTSADLDSVPTVDLATGIVRMFIATESPLGLRAYQLTAGTNAETSPDIIRPDDYAASTNEKVWISVL